MVAAIAYWDNPSLQLPQSLTDKHFIIKHTLDTLFPLFEYFLNLV